MLNANALTLLILQTEVTALPNISVTIDFVIQLQKCMVQLYILVEQLYICMVQLHMHMAQLNTNVVLLYKSTTQPYDPPLEE